MAEGVICYRWGSALFSLLFTSWRKFYTEIYLQSWKAFSVKEGVLLLFKVWRWKWGVERELRFQKRNLELKNINVYASYFLSNFMIFCFPFILPQLSFRRLRNLPLLCPLSLAAVMKMWLQVGFLLGEGKNRWPCTAQSYWHAMVWIWCWTTW